MLFAEQAIIGDLLYVVKMSTILPALASSLLLAAVFDLGFARTVKNRMLDDDYYDDYYDDGYYDYGGDYKQPCINGTQNPDVQFARGGMACCFNVVYDSSSEYELCCQDTVHLKPSSSYVCCGSELYNSNTETCCADGTVKTIGECKERAASGYSTRDRHPGAGGVGPLQHQNP